MDRLDAMRVILAVVDAGSLSAGSRKLNAPLPSVSRKVAELERHLGTNLLVRTSRNILLTDAGRDYVEAARRIIADLDEAERRASGEYSTPRGELTVTMPVEFGMRHVMPIALAFMAEYPEVTLNLITADRIVHMVDDHVDVAIRLGHLADSALYAVKVGEFRLITCASPDYLGRRETPTDLCAAFADRRQQRGGQSGSSARRGRGRSPVRLSTGRAHSIGGACQGATRRRQ
jgi:DNA-binding transcriptional LysR family regulator